MNSHPSVAAPRASRRSRPRFSPRLEGLEDRTVLDVGDTLATALATGLGPAPGYYQNYIEFLGDNVHAGRDVDLYRFQASAGSILTVRTTPGSYGTVMDPLLRLFDSAGNELTTSDDLPTSRYGRIDWAFSAAGTFYVGISGSPNSTYDPTTAGSGAAADEMGHYGLELTLIATPAVGADVGDDLNASMWTDVYGFYYNNGFFASNRRLGDGPYGARDVDLYLFYAAAGTQVTARTLAPYGTAPMVDTLVRLFDLTGAELASNDDGPAEYGLFSQLTYTFATDGFYAIGVSGVPNSSYDPYVPDSGVAGETGLYRVELLLSEVPDPPLADAGDTIQSATFVDLSFYNQVIQRLGDGAQAALDVDFYAFNAAAGQTLLAMTSRPPAGSAVDTFVRLFDSNGFEIAMNDDGGVDFYSALSYRFRTTDTYFLGVSAYPNYTYRPFEDGSGVAGGTGNYRLEAFLVTTGNGPGSAPGQGSDNGSDLVLGLTHDAPAPFALGANSAVQLGQTGQSLPAEMILIPTEALLAPADAPQSRSTTPALWPDLNLMLDLVFGGGE